MKKNLWILGFAAASLMAGCSSNDDVLSSLQGQPDADINAGNSNVEIRLASSAGGTRSSVESTADGLFEADGLGIFCLAKGVQGVNPAERPIVWNGYDELDFSVWMDNIETNAEFNADTTATELNWVDGKKRFYPVANWYTYRFYGYYPRVETIYKSESRIEATIQINGTQDVIWGRTNNNHDDAYSAKYVRNPEHADETPGIEFEHKLMRMTFSIVPGPDAKGEYDAALTMGVKSIKVKDVPTQLNLVIADRNDATAEGKVTFDWDNNLADFDLLDADDAPFGEDHWVQMEETRIGQGILLPVPDEQKDDQHYYVEIVLKDKEGNEFISEHPIELQSSKYEAGKSYNVKMTINGPKLITLNATLKPWDLDTDGTIQDVTL